MKKWKTTFLITLESDGTDFVTTAQIVRDKLLTPIQELWITRKIRSFSIEELNTTQTRKILSRHNQKGERKSFYETGTPVKKK